MKKPMLASKVKLLHELRFPLYVSPKLDGIRCFIENEDVLSRKRKNIPNKRVQEIFGLRYLEGVDGELIVGKPTDSQAFTNTTSGVMSRDGDPDVRLYVFDIMTEEPWITRQARLAHVVRNHAHITCVRHYEVSSVKELMELEKKFVNQGYEGIMLRRADGEYKFGRATWKSQALMKLKRFLDSEAVIIGVEEEMSNQNKKKLNNMGQMRRSSHKAGKVPKGVMGKLRVRDLKTKIEFKVGTGFSHELRRTLWKERNKIKGKIITYKSQEAGVKNKPRIPVFKGFRSQLDL
jgi:DNA ligase-1